MIELKEVIHFYLGCECKDNVTGIRRHLHTVYMGLSVRPVYELLKDGVVLRFYINEFKPILRKVEDMTEEECLLCAELFGPTPTMTKEAVLFQVRKIFTNWHSGVTSITGYCWMKVSAFLLKNGFDIFGLIGSQQAIDAKTLITKTASEEGD